MIDKELAKIRGLHRETLCYSPFKFWMGWSFFFFFTTIGHKARLS